MQHRSLPLADNFSLNAQLKILSGPLDAIVSEKYAENRGDARTLKERLAREFFPINDLINDSPLVPRKWITGDDAFDSFFQGGLPTRRIIELSGESGVGKTQLAIQLSMACQISQECGGLQGSTLYIKSESVFPTDRIYQMKRLFVEKEYPGFSDDHQFADNIYFHHAINLPHLFDILEHQRIGLVIYRTHGIYK
ncbi:hypothetical protein O9G_005287 [Rozella allomycis CSF55]|uniref:RecA family profile 1 domain-containing protein n=1 Tax=Rozella allomycis (strain CSF55) TaxID=988480 RepID=A0A075AS00_ROZAC|nr:hypothetical protein O9G_005287 [Rozella allomycis CSF55]|eukprot:EPZ32955.1 hypothetical protein O9G_005287 [Rozella allomycis CSF55]